MVGKRLQHYEIIEKLGEGGMGVVYKARDSHLDRFVALKVLPPDKVADPERKQRFVREAKTASALNHPNIVTVHDIDHTDGMDFIAMEFVEGRTLDQLIPRHGMRLNEALRIAVQIAEALAAAHSAGIIHRDLKPRNVMITDKGHVKVLDFGLAKLTEVAPLGEDEATRTNRPTTEEGAIVGTVAYMSPEQAEGKKIDARSDIFSFGSVLYEMATGHRAFQGDSKLSTLAAVLRQEPPTLPAELPYDLAKLVTRCLRKDPERRFQHTGDVKIALEELKEESGSDQLAGAPPGRRGHRRRWLWVAVGCLALLAMSAGTWFFQFRSAPGPGPKQRSLSAFRGREQEPALSPDGKQIAFVWDGERQDSPDIYVQLTDEATPRRLTLDPATEYSPVWSPDGLRIAFLRQFTGGTDIFTIPASGGQEHKLWSTAVVCNPRNCGISWSPNGKHLAIFDRESPKEPVSIYGFNIETGERRKVTSPPTGSFGDGRAVFSPDGRKLAFLRTQAVYPSDIYVMAISEDMSPRGEPRRITPERSTVYGMDWTPDGRSLVFSWNIDVPAGLWRISASGGKAPERMPGGESARWPSLARTGGRMPSQASLMTATSGERLDQVPERQRGRMRRQVS